MCVLFAGDLYDHVQHVKVAATPTGLVCGMARHRLHAGVSVVTAKYFLQ